MGNLLLRGGEGRRGRGLLLRRTEGRKGSREGQKGKAVADLGFFLKGGGDFGNPSERSERALRGLGLREIEI